MRDHPGADTNRRPDPAIESHDPRSGSHDSLSGLRELWHALPLAAVLFLFWLVLSGKFDAVHLSAGAVCAVAVAFVSGRLLRLPPALGFRPAHPLAGVRWLGLAAYMPWLVWQVVLANLHVAWIVLHPRMPIDPCLVRLETPTPHALARLTVTNSITLTPGTVTLDVDAEGYLVHALTRTAAAALERGAMLRRVQALFSRVVVKSPEGSP